MFFCKAAHYRQATCPDRRSAGATKELRAPQQPFLRVTCVAVTPIIHALGSLVENLRDMDASLLFSATIGAQPLSLLKHIFEACQTASPLWRKSETMHLAQMDRFIRQLVQSARATCLHVAPGCLPACCRALKSQQLLFEPRFSVDQAKLYLQDAHAQCPCTLASSTLRPRDDLSRDVCTHLHGLVSIVDRSSQSSA
jgi:hypothetical protein